MTGGRERAQPGGAEPAGESRSRVRPGVGQRTALSRRFGLPLCTWQLRRHFASPHPLPKARVACEQTPQHTTIRWKPPVPKLQALNKEEPGGPAWQEAGFAETHRASPVLWPGSICSPKCLLNYCRRRCAIFMYMHA